jgi:phosphoribosylamine--glycine ligase
MKVFVIGGGGREHAIVWSLKKSDRVKEIYCAPGNAGIARLAKCVPIDAVDLSGLLNFAKSNHIDLTVVGPEMPLVAGIVDAFKKHGLKIYGPSREAAALEGSKAFTKEFCAEYNIPSAASQTFSDIEAAKRYVKSHEIPMVIKADGLASGKGVIICNSHEEALKALEEIMRDKKFGTAGGVVVVEDFLEGEEASFIAVCDGNHVLPLASSQDHKAAFDFDKGPNTGGMGAVSPAGVVTDEIVRKVMEEIMLPAARGMVTCGMPFVGTLYAGLMIKDGAPKLLEFNVRFGDPETQVLLMRLRSDIVDVFEGAISGNLDKVHMVWDKRPAGCVVMASGGYPSSYEKGKVISGLDDAIDSDETVVFHAGTKLLDGKTVTDGGRVLGVTALGDDLSLAMKNAYAVVEKINWDGVYYRKDIGRKAVG